MYCAIDSTGASPAHFTGTVTLAPQPSALPDCDPHDTTVTVRAPVSVIVAAGALARAASGLGYRLDGLPCVANKSFAGCQVQGSKRDVGIAGSVVHSLVARLTADPGGHMTGHLIVTDLS